MRVIILQTEKWGDSFKGVKHIIEQGYTILSSSCYGDIKAYGNPSNLDKTIATSPVPIFIIKIRKKKFFEKIY